MELAFDSKALRTICEKEADGIREFGPRVAEVLRHRLADLRAANFVQDLLAGRPRLMGPADPKCMIVDLCDNHHLILCANHPRNPTVESGGIDWSRVSRIKILRIESNHDER